MGLQAKSLEVIRYSSRRWPYTAFHFLQSLIHSHRRSSNPPVLEQRWQTKWLVSQDLFKCEAMKSSSRMLWSQINEFHLLSFTCKTCCRCFRFLCTMLWRLCTAWWFIQYCADIRCTSMHTLSISSASVNYVTNKSSRWIVSNATAIPVEVTRGKYMGEGSGHL